MRTTSLLCGLLAALFCWPVIASDWLPTAGLRIEFGGAARAHLAASFGSAWRDMELTAGRPLPLSNFSFDSGTGLSCMLLGVPLQGPPRWLDQQDDAVVVDEHTGTSYTWLWVALGVAALATAEVMSKEDHGDETSSSGQNKGCNIIGGDVIGPQPLVILGPDCSGSLPVNPG